jgi:hypothetical protein
MWSKSFIMMVVIMGAISLNGCASLSKTVTKEQQEAADYASTPFAPKDPYYLALKSVGYMYEALYRKKIIIAIDLGESEFKKNSKLPMTMDDVLINSFGQIQGGVDIMYLRDTRIEGVKPDYILTASLCGFDADVHSKNGAVGGGVGAGGGDTSWDASASASENATVSFLEVTLNLKYGRNSKEGVPGIIVPGATVKNTIGIYSVDNAVQFSAFVGRSGGSWNHRFRLGLGISQALGILLNYSVVELMGQVFPMPYWYTVNEKEPNEAVLKSIMKGFEAADKRTQIVKIQEMLACGGYKLIADGVRGPKTKKAISHFLSRIEKDGTEVSLAELYKLLLLELGKKYVPPVAGA